MGIGSAALALLGAILLYFSFNSSYFFALSAFQALAGLAALLWGIKAGHSIGRRTALVGLTTLLLNALAIFVRI